MYGLRCRTFGFRFIVLGLRIRLKGERVKGEG
jgi:hypothetical protein